MTKDILLHLLIILLPLNLYQAFFMGAWNNKLAKASPWMLGLFMGASSVLCMLFPINLNGVFWDLRSIPLFISFLYGGRRVGLLTSVIILTVRPMLGWDPLVYLFVWSTHLLYILPPLFIGKAFHRMTKLRKLICAAGLGFFAQASILLNISILSIVKGGGAYLSVQELGFFLWTLAIMVMAMVLPVLMLEALRDNLRWREEVQKSEKLSLISELAASVAHEVRNPLTVVRGFLQLTYNNLTGKNKEYLTVAITELTRAETIISDYLSFARPQLEVVGKVDVADTLRNVTDVIGSYAAMNNVKLECELEEQLFISGDSAKLKQAAINLIKNAIESIEDGGRVHIRAGLERDAVRISVLDSGKGMSEEQIKRLGHPFYTTKAKGTGLGLMVTFKLIEAMRGTIHIESAQGEGTRATVLFPSAV